MATEFGDRNSKINQPQGEKPQPVTEMREIEAALDHRGDVGGFILPPGCEFQPPDPIR